MGDCVPLAVIKNFVSRDSGRLYGDVQAGVIRRSPYLDVFPKGTLESGMGDSFRVPVQERAIMASGMVNPTFAADITMCRSVPNLDGYGNKEFTFSLGTLRGRSGPICVKQARGAFKTSYMRVSDSLKQGLRDITNAEARAQAIFVGGSKAVCDSTGTFAQDVTAPYLGIQTPFPGGRTPDSPPSFRFLKKIANHLKDVNAVNPFVSDNQGEMVKCIFSEDITDILRDESGITNDLRAETHGRYNDGHEDLVGFSFEGPYRGIAFATDPQPLRAVAVAQTTPAAGQPNAGVQGYYLSPSAAPFSTDWVPGYSPTDTSTLKLAFVQPEISVNTTNGTAARPNPDWIAAIYEVGTLWFDNSFKRLIPETYKGEGDVKFTSQIGLETLEFDVLKDNDCNRFADTGDWIYEVSRAYEPIRPDAICAILYKRPVTVGNGLTATS